MRAVSYAEFGGPEVLRVADVPVPEPGPGQVRVKVAASAVHPVDLMIRSGRFPAPLPTGLPYTPGWDVAGTVDAVDPAVEQVTIGDEVIGFSPWPRTTVGTHAEYAVLDAAWLAAAPVGVPPPRRRRCHSTASPPPRPSTCSRHRRVRQCSSPAPPGRSAGSSWRWPARPVCAPRGSPGPTTVCSWSRWARRSCPARTSRRGRSTRSSTWR
ncbi:alcohol dehydrogenase catalytic domain-containing protein [Micromonospora sp. M12]